MENGAAGKQYKKPGQPGQPGHGNPSPDPLAAFLADPHGTPQADLDRLLAGAHRLDPHLLSSFNVALAWRAGLDPQEVFDACHEFDEPAPLPTDV